MTTIRSRTSLISSTLALVPLLLAIIVGIPADASPTRQAPLTVSIEEERSPTPAGDGFEVTIDTGVVHLGGGTAISALTVTATTVADGED